MNKFTFTYPTKVYFGQGMAKEALSQELPKVGETVVIKITNMQIPGVITEASPIPGADGKRRIIITPKVPASQIFAPGLPVQVTIKDQQA